MYLEVGLSVLLVNNRAPKQRHIEIYSWIVNAKAEPLSIEDTCYSGDWTASRRYHMYVDYVVSAKFD